MIIKNWFSLNLSLSELLNEEQFQLLNLSNLGWRFNAFASEKNTQLFWKPQI